MKKSILVVMYVFVFLGLVVPHFNLVSAQQNTVCCEQTKSGAFCQDVPATECSEGSRQVPTSCEATSFCQTGTCYDSNEGTCLDNTPQIVCNQNGGIWEEESPPQCDLGCCILGDQAAFVTLVRCKKLSGFLGLETNYDSSISSEFTCVQTVQQQEKGACVYDFEFERTCKFTTRAECESDKGVLNGTSSNKAFFPNLLCSAEQLGTDCGPTTQTTCLSGKDGVYFVDSCGNPANIYDSSKINDQDYWTNVKSQTESCNPNSGNAGSKNCGNCNYLQGSFCRSEDKAAGSPSYGNFICADLNCVDSSGEKRVHGESWCVSDSKTIDNSVGSGYFRQICNNGEIITESCADFRNEECIENTISTNEGDFSQAACRVNRWQDCLAQTKQGDCENSDRRDCVWQEGVTLNIGNQTEKTSGVCLPENSPGLNFWQGEEALSFCSQANTQCVVKFEKGLFGGEECKGNCECLSDEWKKERSDVCSALGDCGPTVNWVGEKSRNNGFEIISS